MNSKTDITIIGAGPVGLWDAIQILQHRPDKNIQIYERHETYQRDHALRLLPLSSILYTDFSSTARKKQFYQEIFDKGLSQVFLRAATNSGSVLIKTNDLEAALKSYALDLGAQLDHLHITGPTHAMDLNPGCQTFIAADGAKSPMRVALLGADDIAVTTTPLQYILETKYKTVGQPGKLDFFSGQYKTNKILKHTAFEYVGREKDGITPVNVRFFLTRKMFEAVPSVTFKEPLTLDDPRIPKALADDIHAYLNVRRIHANENMVPGSAKLGKLMLSAYVANQWATEFNGANWHLSGDSGMGIPFFRALNAGFFSGSQLAYIVTREWLNKDNQRRAHNAVRPLDKFWEFTLAHGKNQAVQAYEAFKKVNTQSPLEFNKWGREEIEEIIAPSGSCGAGPKQP